MEAKWLFGVGLEQVQDVYKRQVVNDDDGTRLVEMRVRVDVVGASVSRPAGVPDA